MIWLSLVLRQLIPHIDAVEGIDEVDAVLGYGHEREDRVGHEPHGDVGHVDDEPEVPLLDESLDRDPHGDDAKDGGEAVEPEL